MQQRKRLKKQIQNWSDAWKFSFLLIAEGETVLLVSEKEYIAHIGAIAMIIGLVLMAISDYQLEKYRDRYNYTYNGPCD